MVFASLHPGTQAMKRSTSQIKFHTFSLGARISTSFSNCKIFLLRRSCFCYQKSAEVATQCKFFQRRVSLRPDRPFTIAMDREGLAVDQTKVCKPNRFRRLWFLDP